MSRATTVLICGIAGLICVPIYHAGLRNRALLAAGTQLTQGRSDSWGLGLRALNVGTVVSATPLPTSRQWTTESRLGLDALPGEVRLATLRDCTSRRLTAQRAMRDGRWQESARLLETVVVDCPHHAFASLELGLTYDRLNQPAAAVRAFEAGGVGPFAREIAAVDYLKLASDCHRRPEAPRDDCLRWLQRAYELAPHNAAAAIWRAAQTGEASATADLDLDRNASWSDPRMSDLVIDALADLAAREPDRDLRPGIARAFGFRRRFREALATYASMLQTKSDAQTRYYAGLTAAALGDWPASTRYLRLAVEDAPGHVEYLSALARAHAAAGSPAAAEPLYRRALTLEPCLPEATAFLDAAPPPGSECARRSAAEFEAEALHSVVGRVVPDIEARGGQAMAGQGGYVVYGPYQSLPPGRYTARFTVKSLRRLRAGCLTLDISALTDTTAGSWLMTMPSRRLSDDVLPSGRYVDVDLAFQSPGGGRFEYRVLEECGSEVSVDRIAIFPVR